MRQTMLQDFYQFYLRGLTVFFFKKKYKKDVCTKKDDLIKTVIIQWLNLKLPNRFI